jgi:putative oxidoreductase
VSGERRRIVHRRKELRSAAMKTATAIARFVLGLVFVVFGLNGFLNFMPMGPVPALAGQFAGALIQSHYMAVVLTLEIVSGLFLLTNSYAGVSVTQNARGEFSRTAL